MTISRTALEKIKKIVDQNYRALILKVSGADRRLLDLVYRHNVLNDADEGPTTIEGMLEQQKDFPNNSLHEAALEHLNATVVQLVEKLKVGAQTSIEGVVREYNLDARNKLIQGITESPASESMGKLKTKLRDISKDAVRDWRRISVTETANAVGMGSVDRVVAQNRGANFDQVYVFRIITPDAATCKWCRKFYQDEDGTPALYRLSTLLANGSNYGKKPQDWLAVIGATHPNERCSPLIQVKRGWRILSGGKLDFAGLEGWDDYVEKKLRT